MTAQALPILAALALAVGLAGCAGREPIACWDFPGGRVCKGDPNYVAKTCTPEAGAKWDSGKPRPKWVPVSGCTNRVSKRVLVTDDCAGAKAAAVHERAHQAGIANPKEAGCDWEASGYNDCRGNN